jgi:hypothetical protein
MAWVYEIIYDTLKVYPISLIKISDSNYENLPSVKLYPNKYIEFSIKIIETIR